MAPPGVIFVSVSNNSGDLRGLQPLKTCAKPYPHRSPPNKEMNDEEFIKLVGITPFTR